MYQIHTDYANKCIHKLPSISLGNSSSTSFKKLDVFGVRFFLFLARTIACQEALRLGKANTMFALV